MQIAEDTQVIVLNICIKWIVNKKNQEYKEMDNKLS